MQETASRIRAEATALFAQAYRLEAQGLFDDAFAAFTEANRLKRQTVQADRYAQGHALIVENLPFLFPPAIFKAHRGEGHPSRAPIFIVGHPRSGSTLLEQVLDSHSLAQGMGEISAMRHALHRRYPYPGPPPATGHFRQVGEDYLDEVKTLGWSGLDRFVDKQLMNYREIGSIRLAFPEAIIIHARRDPIDTCLSAFRQDFTHSGPWGSASDTSMSYDLAEAGAHYARYREIMRYWNETLPGAVIEVRHEAFVADFPNQARRLLDVCGLRWEDDCLRFYDNPREVLTGSKDQVRRPIFTSSIGRWRCYEKHLGPLIEALGPYATVP